MNTRPAGISDEIPEADVLGHDQRSIARNTPSNKAKRLVAVWSAFHRVAQPTDGLPHDRSGTRCANAAGWEYCEPRELVLRVIRRAPSALSNRGDVRRR